MAVIPFNHTIQQIHPLKYAITEMIILRKVRSNRRMAENIIFPLDYGWAQSENNIPYICFRPLVCLNIASEGLLNKVPYVKSQ